MPIKKRDYMPDIKRNLRVAQQKLLQANTAAANPKKRKVMLRGAQQAYQRALTMARQLPFSTQADALKKECEKGFAGAKRLVNQMAQQERREREADALIHAKEGDGGDSPDSPDAQAADAAAAEGDARPESGASSADETPQGEDAPGSG